MKFPIYKIHSLVGLFKIRMERYDFLDRNEDEYRTWGSCAAYNSNRILRIGNLPLVDAEVSPWRQLVLHEVIYFNRRYMVYTNRWQKSYEQCSLALQRPQRNLPEDRYNLWQIVAFTEASRLNVNYFREPTNSRLNRTIENWNAAFELNAWVLRQKPIQSGLVRSFWGLAFISINRDLFRGRRFGWESCAKRETENLSIKAKSQGKSDNVVEYYLNSNI